jgi:hypothetical protein
MYGGVGYKETSEVWITAQPLRKQKRSSKYFPLPPPPPTINIVTAGKKSPDSKKYLRGNAFLAANVMNTNTMSVHDKR